MKLLRMNRSQRRKDDDENQTTQFFVSERFYLFLIMSTLVLSFRRSSQRWAKGRGIKTVIVRVHSFEREWASELGKAALTESVLQASIERQLEKSGIAVIPEEASKKTETEGILNVRVKFLIPNLPKNHL